MRIHDLLLVIASVMNITIHYSCAPLGRKHLFPHTGWAAGRNPQMSDPHRSSASAEENCLAQVMSLSQSGPSPVIDSCLGHKASSLLSQLRVTLKSHPSIKISHGEHTDHQWDCIAVHLLPLANSASLLPPFGCPSPEPS